MSVEQAVSKRMCGVGIVMCGLLLLAVAMIMGLEFPKFVFQKNLNDLCILDTNHRLYQHWVDDTFREKFNRIYYWELTNKEDFLHNGAFPKVAERGPYVYREEERKQEVRFSFSSVDFYLQRWQRFDPGRTRRECGPNCTEHDQITILNTEYLKQVGKYGGDVNYALLYVPRMLDTAIKEVGLLTNTNDSAAMALFGRNSSDNSVEQLTRQLGFPEAFGSLALSDWLGLRDSVYKRDVLNYRRSPRFSGKEMSGLLTVLRNPVLLGTTSELLSRTSYVTQCDLNANSFRLPAARPDLGGAADVRQYATEPPACSFYACLSRYVELQRSARYVSNVTDCIARYLCPNANTSCFALPVNPYFQNAYIFALHGYLTSHLTRYALYKYVLEPGNGLVVTRPQSDLALGYVRLNATHPNEEDDSGKTDAAGILENTPDEADVRWKSRKLSLYNCYDSKEAQTNFFWKGIDGETVVSQDQFPNATGGDRSISGHWRSLPPTKELVACEDTLLARDSYQFYLPQFWRRITFWPHEVKYVGGHLVQGIIVNESFFKADDVYLSEDGLQPMDGTYGYVSWLSLPNFLYAEDILIDAYDMKPNEQKHTLKMSVEPVTGAVWESSIKYQVNVGIKPIYTTVRRPEELNLNSTTLPLPVYWVESSFYYNTQGHDEYEDRSGRLIRAACGGLIGMSFLASLAVLIGIMAATIRIRSGRVAPAQVSDGI